ncbi:Clavaminate synthase-like protein [Aulographum hederae CBS 113979]|uniref:Clavaminate synthase-like protein n=1 Tax=Aulographum hederae CBS 113979 TaxID=1176131 RepID=A0A6G1GKH9_9PEZI|nr:Clavaminate synthase-like protein [Aulographum hederae CBS 113979]
MSHPIPRLHDISLEEFQQHLDTPPSHPTTRSSSATLDPDVPTPIVIAGALSHWPALSDPSRRWDNPDYLLRRTLGGRRLVPVEVGRSYVDEGWGQRIMTFGEFVRGWMVEAPVEKEEGVLGEGEHGFKRSRENKSGKELGNTVEDSRSQTAYLAQHPLFTQLPSLRADILTPDYCYSKPPPAPSAPIPCDSSYSDSPDTPEPLLNAWFGPAHTISPLHTDPHHNILCQVVGHKYIRLYPPSETPRLYPRGRGEDGVDMSNTSQVDLDIYEGRGEAAEAERLKREFPEFCKATYADGVLGPGECLYIPVGWWHYVRSLSASFSVSFWFN